MLLRLLKEIGSSIWHCCFIPWKNDSLMGNFFLLRNQSPFASKPSFPKISSSYYCQLGQNDRCHLYCGTRASLVAQMVKNPPEMKETWIRSLGWEDPLEKGMATHSSILAWRISMDRGAWWATVHGAQRAGHDWVTKPSTAQLRFTGFSVVSLSSSSHISWTMSCPYLNKANRPSSLSR